MLFMTPFQLFKTLLPQLKILVLFVNHLVALRLAPLGYARSCGGLDPFYKAVVQ